MATISFDRRIDINETAVPNLLDALEKENIKPVGYYDVASPEQMERNEQLLKHYFSN